MLYLTDVSERSPCFSISPEDCTRPVLPIAEQLAMHGFHDVRGPAGTCLLFNVSLVHRASVCVQGASGSSTGRKSVQIYYGHRECQSGDMGTPKSWFQRLNDPTIAGAGSSTANKKQHLLPEEERWAEARRVSAARDTVRKLNEGLTLPPCLWRDHADEACRLFCKRPKIRYESCNSVLSCILLQTNSISWVFQTREQR